jgi:hypothetical protein
MVIGTYPRIAIAFVKSEEAIALLTNGLKTSTNSGRLTDKQGNGQSP